MNQNEASFRPAFTGQEQAEIKRLQADGLKKGIGYKIDPGTASGILLTGADKTLTGFMTADCFGGSEIESAAIANNADDWAKMNAVLSRHARQTGKKRILYICDPKDTLVRQILDGLGLVAAFAEYRMELCPADFSPAPADGIALRQAMETDLEAIKKLDEEAFGAVGPVSAADIDNTQIILYNNKPAGKLRAQLAEGVEGIYGVVIEQALRGRGIGAGALTLFINGVMAEGRQRIYLEVDSQNPAAFHLYKKLGFQVVSEFGYYAFHL